MPSFIKTYMRTKLVCTLIVMLAALLFSSALAQDGDYGLEWQRSLPGLSGTAVISTSDGGYLALGEDASYNSTTGEFYGAHPVVVKADGDGNLVWSKTVVYDEGGPRTAALASRRGKRRLHSRRSCRRRPLSQFSSFLPY